MLAFEITVNGNRLCVIGTDGLVAAVGVDWTFRHPEQVAFHIGGVNQAGHHVGWNAPAIGIGDEVKIRIIEAESADSPDKIRDHYRKPPGNA